MNASEARVKAKQLSADGKTYAEIAKILMDKGYRGPQGGTRLGPSTVSKLINYGIRPRAKGRTKVAKARRAAPVVAAATHSPIARPHQGGFSVIKAIRLVLSEDSIADSAKVKMITSLTSLAES